MKKMIFGMATAIAVVFTSCGGGWTDESKKSTKEKCNAEEKKAYDEADAMAICDCYMDNVVKKYPEAHMTPDQDKKEMEECAKGYKTTAVKKAEKEQMEMDAMSSMQTLSGDSITVSDAPIEAEKEAPKKH